MYSISDLESQWRRYKQKRILYYVLAIVVFLSIVGIVIYYATPDKDSVDMGTPSMKLPKDDTVKMNNPGNSHAPRGPRENNNPKAKKGWSMTFSDQENTSPEQKSSSGSRHIDIEVKSKNSKMAANDIESRFAYSNDKDDALFLARYYYDKGEYNKSLKWALEVNKLDSNIEEGWLVFCKSKAKLGLRIEAIRVLQSYLDRSGSSKARSLLGKIRLGKTF